MKFNKDLLEKRWVAYTIATCSAVVLFFLLSNLGDIFNGVKVVYKILSPLVTGLIIAYIIDPFVTFLKKTVFADIKNENTKKKCVIEIEQNDSKITINSYYADENGIETSKSESISEEIIKKNNGFYDLYYIFTNKPYILNEGLSNHSVTCKLPFYPEDKKLEGEYYNARLCKGKISVKFTDKHIKGKF